MKNTLMGIIAAATIASAPTHAQTVTMGGKNHENPLVRMLFGDHPKPQLPKDDNCEDPLTPQEEKENPLKVYDLKYNVVGMSGEELVPYTKTLPNGKTAKILRFNFDHYVDRNMCQDKPRKITQFQIIEPTPYFSPLMSEVPKKTHIVNESYLNIPAGVGHVHLWTDEFKSPSYVAIQMEGNTFGMSLKTLVEYWGTNDSMNRTCTTMAARSPFGDIGWERNCAEIKIQDKKAQACQTFERKSEALGDIPLQETACQEIPMKDASKSLKFHLANLFVSIYQGFK